MSTITPAFNRWWLQQTAKGDPQRNPNLTRDAFAAGYSAGMAQAEREAREDVRAAAAEATWRERQGEDYGSY